MAEEEKEVGKEKLTLSSSEESRSHLSGPVPICDSFGEKGKEDLMIFLYYTLQSFSIWRIRELQVITLVLNSLWLFFHLVPLRSSSTNQFLSPCGFLSVTIMLGKEFCGLYKNWCGKVFKFWTCHLVVEFDVFWLLCCSCSSLAWHCCEFTCFCIIEGLWREKQCEDWQFIGCRVL